MVREGFQSVRKGLRDSFPLQLYHKAKRFFWDPQAIDLSQDLTTYQNLSEAQREAALHLASLFVAGEEAVTLDLLPLIQVIAQEGRLEEEMYLTTFLLDEAKHVEFFSRLIGEVVGGDSQLDRFHGANYRKIFYEELPKAMNRLREDPSPEAQAEAAVTYNMIVEGVLAETGYYAYQRSAQILAHKGHAVPGILEGIRYVQRDESRHIAYGLYLLSRLMSEHPGLWEVVERRMNYLLPYAVGVVQDIFKAYPQGFPLELEVGEFVQYAMSQFQKRYRRLEQARHQSLEEIEQVALEAGEEA
ncbi:ribonucleotide reductase, beta subunit [Thermus oshimai JL-2]|uniref:R2-like ligand binding oxidase n=1 Tax=Thermus oshimai JL-2 TaxID=751945 RepID=K7QXL2_THEOS|nr:R2-like ligand-binding oxidase [Thermus oshimai]AFV76568.1 ribonucleotide reductase, beta subunit [Thermus oshimai JL-2]